MRCFKYVFVIPLLVICLILPARGQKDIRSVLPALESLQGWQYNKAPRVYPGDKLFDLINGGADIYYEYGFTQVVSVTYNDPAHTVILVEIYEMSDPSAGYGIFSLMQQTAEWCKTYGNVSAVRNDYIAFWQGNYYVNISWSSRQHKDIPPLTKLAKMICDNIEDDGGYPYLVEVFQAMNAGEKTVFMKGNLALSNFYYFDFRDLFEIREGIACTPGDHHRIVLKYDNVTTAQAVLTSSRQSILANKRFSDVAMSFQGYTCKDNKGNRILVRQVDRFLVIIVGLVPNMSLAPYMDEVMQKIENLP
jgi:hypothetical protein